MTKQLSERMRLAVALLLSPLLGCGGDLKLPTATGEGVDLVRAVSPLSQPGRIGEPTNENPTVLVLDGLGNPVSGAAVAWTVTTGRGSTSSEQTATGADGRASVTWTLGVSIGVQKLAARVEGAHGSPVTFTATVLF